MPTKDSRDSMFLPGKLSRRTALKGAAALGVASGVGMPFGQLANAAALQSDDPPEGGTLRVAVIGEAPAVADATFTTAKLTNDIAAQVFEGLFAFDAAFGAQPMLVEDYELSDDDLTFTFHLRSDVTFHNGDPLTANDVVASLDRWGAINGRGRLIYGRMESIEATDDSTFTMTFTEPTGVLPSFLARSEAMILPASIAEAAGEDQLTLEQLIGTGPFRIEEHLVDRHLRLVRFEEYSARDEEPDGRAGRKVAYLDAIEIIPVPDESVRANGVLTGEYHFADSVPADFFDTLDQDPSVEALVVQPYYWYCPHFNKAEGVFTDVRMRHAVQLGFSQADAMVAGFGREEFIRIDPSLFGEETVWYSDAGSDAYNNSDPERAQQLMEEAGYDGEPIRILTTREYPEYFLIGDFMRQELESIGMNIELIVVDWATVVSQRADPTAYDLFITGHSQYSHPATMAFNDPAWPGWWESEAKDEVVSAMLAEADPDRFQELVDEYMTLIWEEMPFVKLGDHFALRGQSQNVVNLQNDPDWYFWNVGLNQ
jgi:peptide/nickel transport system substrate-binding protein